MERLTDLSQLAGKTIQRAEDDELIHGGSVMIYFTDGTQIELTPQYEGAVMVALPSIFDAP